MAWKTLKVRMIGVGKSIQHNGQLADPLNKFSKAIKEITGKRKKTDADHEQIAKLEFMGGLYMNGDGPEWPGYVIEGVLVKGAKKFKEGDRAKSGVIVEKGAKLEYKGPRDPEGIWKEERFRNVALVPVGQARIVRTRPQFEDWSCVVSVEYNDEILNESHVFNWLAKAGAEVGIGDWRPRYGRFTVEKV